MLLILVPLLMVLHVLWLFLLLPLWFLLLAMGIWWLLMLRCNKDRERKGQHECTPTCV